MALAPILLTAYNRPYHTKETIEALKLNELAKFSDFYIYLDGPNASKPDDPKKVNEISRYVNGLHGFKSITIVENVSNKGLAENVITGVSAILSKHKNIIVLEDDLVTQKYFLNVMNQMLDFYQNDARIGAVTAFMQTETLVKFPNSYKNDVFFNVRPCSTGWGTWLNRWEQVNWDIEGKEKFLADKTMQKQFNRGGNDLTQMLIKRIEGKIDSWAIRWSYHHFLKSLKTVQTTKSYIDNIGYDGLGINSKDESYYYRQNKMATKKSLDLQQFDGHVDFNLIRRYTAPQSFGWAYIKRKLYSKLGIRL